MIKTFSKHLQNGQQGHFLVSLPEKELFRATTFYGKKEKTNSFMTTTVVNMFRILSSWT